MGDSIRRQHVNVFLLYLFESHGDGMLSLTGDWNQNWNNSQNYQWSVGKDLTVALRGTTRGLWFQSQAARAINHHDATLFTSQTEAWDFNIQLKDLTNV